MAEWSDLFDESPLKQAARQFAASTQMHALVELGFEDHMNSYEARDLALIGSQSNGPIQRSLYEAAKEKADAETLAILEEIL